MRQVRLFVPSKPVANAHLNPLTKCKFKSDLKECHNHDVLIIQFLFEAVKLHKLVSYILLDYPLQVDAHYEVSINISFITPQRIRVNFQPYLSHALVALLLVDVRRACDMRTGCKYS